MISYPNQKLYHIKKRIEKEDIFVMVRWEDFTQAAKELSSSGLKLYMYLAKNQDDYKFYFSSSDYCKTFGVVDKTCRNAKKELIDKGYLYEDPESNNVYFDARGGYKITREQLGKRLIELYGKIASYDEKKALDFKVAVHDTNLKEIESDKVYMIEAKKLIAFGEDMLKEIGRIDIENLI